ncbi:MAG: hypothetical protein JNL43_11505 [Flavobacteriales bacterium]|nr:hypothetical protein [Flavobacteriales bacterium]
MKRPILITLVGAVIGACAGWFYWYQVGCSRGSCAITSDPVNSSLYGAFLVGLLFNSFVPSTTRNTPSSNDRSGPQYPPSCSEHC